MRSTAELRKQVESALADRIPAALSFRPQERAELLSCGVGEVDEALGRGLSIGAITELTGAASSGRTTLALAALAEVTRQGGTCAYVDVSDSFDPLSAATLGVDLRRLLWVRAAGPEAACAEEADAIMGSSPSPMVAPAPARAEKHFAGAGWCHPRNEVAGLDRAICQLFRTEEKDVDFTPRCSESIRRERVEPVVWIPQESAKKMPGGRSRKAGKRLSWTRLDQALRATDLLLTTGGFRAVVLDMGDVPSEQARRVPLATWYRFRLQVEKSRTLFLLLTRVACANSCAAVSLEGEQARGDWQRASDQSPALLAGLRYRVSVARNRNIDPTRKKPAASVKTVWRSVAPWSR